MTVFLLLQFWNDNCALTTVFRFKETLRSCIATVISLETHSLNNRVFYESCTMIIQRMLTNLIFQ